MSTVTEEHNMELTTVPMRRKSRRRRKLLTALIAPLIGAAVLAAPGTAQASGTYQGCPSGYVCIYPENTGWNGGHPSLFYYYYGSYNLSNQFNVHRIFNNQTGGATMRTCTGYNGTGCQGYLGAGWYIDKDLTPINSITLEP